MAKQARAHATRELIIQAASVVFSQQTYAQATLAEVLREAGVTQGALYFHFDSKQALGQEVIDRQHRLFVEAGESLLREPIRGLPAMIILSRELAGHITSSPLVRAGLRLSTESAEVFARTARQPYEDWIETCELLVRRAVSEGDIPTSRDPARIATFVIATFSGVQALSQARTQWVDLLDRLEEMWSFLLDGIATEVDPAEKLDIRALLTA
jgi:TetR/AcrR family transcriptional repressor of uid operon